MKRRRWLWTHHAVVGLWDVDTFHQQLHSGRLPNKHNRDVSYNAVYVKLYVKLKDLREAFQCDCKTHLSFGVFLYEAP